jgi:hypothetical protein
MMNRKRIALAATAFIAVAAMGLSAMTADADTANPTRAEALAGASAARLYVQQHPGDSGENEALDGADALTDYITAHVDPVPTTTTTTTPAVTGLPTSVTAVPAANKITLSWQAPVGATPTGYIYGRNGTDNTGTGPWTSTAQAATLRSVVLDKLIDGTSYTVFVEAVYSTGNKRVSLTVTAGVPATTPPTVTPTTVPPTTVPPTTVPPTTTPPTTTTPPVTGAYVSGLPWASGVWTNQDLAQSNRFMSIVRGGRTIDNFPYHTWRDSIGSQNRPAEWRTILPANFDQTKQNLVLAMTTWMGDGSFMNGAQATAFGVSACSVDTTPIIRLDWEMNLQDGAGQNGAVLAASNYSAWVARFRTTATNIKAACPGARIDFNPNHGTDQTTGCNSGTYAAPNNCSRRAFQALKDVVDIFGIDRYDAWPAVTASNSGWSGHLNGYNELDDSRSYALANGKKWSVPEWGLWTGGPGGNDDPKYIQNYVAYFAAHAGDMAYEDYFNEPDPYINSDLIDHNPNSRAAYRAAILAQ